MAAINFITNAISSYFRGIATAVLGNSSKFPVDINRGNFAKAQNYYLNTDYADNLTVAKTVPHLNVVISKGAEMFSNLEIKHIDRNGDKINDSDVIKLLNTPNPLQTLEDLTYDFYIYNAACANTFIYKNLASKYNLIPASLWLLDSTYMSIHTTGKRIKQLKKENIISKYKYSYTDGVADEFEPNEIIHLCEGFKDDSMIASSKIKSLQIPLSNIYAALKSNNIILTERGLIGFISGEPTNTGIIQTDAERKLFERKFQRDRDLDSRESHVAITNAPLKWNPMTFDVQQLMLYEGLENSFKLICSAYGIDEHIFSISGSTYENKRMGMKNTIQNTMQPLATKLCNRLANDFGLTEKGEYLIASYEHLPVMQEDIKAMNDAQKVKAETMSLLLRDKLISKEQYAREVGVEFDYVEQNTNNTNTV